MKSKKSITNTQFSGGAFSNFNFPLTDNYGDNKLTYNWPHIKHPQGFALKQQTNYHCAQFYLEKMVKNSIYNDHDHRVFEFIFNTHIEPSQTQLQTFLTDHYYIQNDESLDREDLLSMFFSFPAEPFNNKSSTHHSIFSESKEETITSYLQILIVGAVLFRRSFEKIGIHYELNTQTNLNKDITRMYEKLVGLNMAYSPII